MDELRILEPFDMMKPELFPESEELPEGCVAVSWKDRFMGLPVELHPNVIYQSLSGEDQHLQIIVPSDMPAVFGAPAPLPQKYPLIVQIPGSAFHRQIVWHDMKRMMEVASHGFVCAIVEYRPTEIGAVYPAQRDDVTAAVRWLKAHAAEYSIDPERVAIWGDSSGGHTAVSVTVNTPELISCCVDWFGPMDITLMNYYPSGMDHYLPESPEGYLIGRKNVVENPELANATSPLRYITPEKPLPPFLIMHGSKDMLVPFNQSVRLYNKLRECGKNVRFYKLMGAGHGFDGFESEEAIKLVIDFIRDNV